MAIPHPYGRLQFGADLELHFRTLIGTGSNPNVAAVVVIGIEDQWTQKIVDGIAATGKPVTGFGIEQHGDHETIMRASKVAREYVQWASELEREECSIDTLWVSTKCGESDTTSGLRRQPHRRQCIRQALSARHDARVRRNHRADRRRALGGRALSDPAVREKFMQYFNRYQQVIDRHKTSDLSDSQPTKGNILGGLTTIEEKALGNIQKIGANAWSMACSTRPKLPRGRACGSWIRRRPPRRW